MLDVIVIGAGFSGVCAAIKLREQGITNFQVFDKAPKVGGTWYHNTYPGVACDVASHLYCYSFEPNPNWSRVFAPGAEIRDYIEHCTKKYGVDTHINHGMACTGARFNDQNQLWEVSFADGSVYTAHHVIVGNGGLHVPSFPNIQGRDEFAGVAMHSAEWNHEVDLTGKRVAMVGTAASAVQILPEIAKIAAHVDVYQRTPNYIMPRNDRDYTEKEKQRFARFPLLAKLLRTKLFYKGELTSYPLVKTKEDTKYSLKARDLINLFMRKSVQDESAHPHLTPDYGPGCKRILLSDSFFATLNKDNVSLVTDGVQRIQADGIVTGADELRKADVIIFATGYDIEKHMLSLPITGPKGINLMDTWTQLPEAYEGAMVAGYPNIFFTTGPNTGVGTTSVVYMIEKQVGFILQCIKKAGHTGLVAPTQRAQREFNDEIQEKLQGTVWAGNCKSYYKREDGKIATLYPYNARTFTKRHKKVDWTHVAMQPRTVAATLTPATQESPAGELEMSS